jgi:hypothetical protein
MKWYEEMKDRGLERNKEEKETGKSSCMHSIAHGRGTPSNCDICWLI